MSDHELKVGDLAPIFELKTQDGTRFNIKDAKKATLLFFYPGDMTPGCTMQLCAVRDDWQKFKDAEIEVYGVNHADAVSHKAFIEKHRLPFPLLIDTDKKVSTKYAAVKPFFSSNIIKRSVIGIDQNGVIRYLRRGMPKNAEILKAMEKGTKKTKFKSQNLNT